MEPRPCRNLQLWCRNCNVEAVEACADQEHALCSFRKLRSERTANRLGQLETAAASVQAVVQALQGVMAEVNTTRANWQNMHQLKEEAERDLRAALDTEVNLTAAQLSLEAVAQSLGITGATVEAAIVDWLNQHRLVEETARELRASLDEGTDLNAAQAAEPQDTQPLNQATAATTSHDVRHLTRRGMLSRDLLQYLQDPNLSQVTKLVGVSCLWQPTWCRALLQRVANSLEHLQIEFAKQPQMNVISGMRALRFVDLYWTDDDMFAAHLPLQLQDLRLCNAAPVHVASVQRMPALRTLALHVSDPLSTPFAPLPAGHHGLERLSVSLRPLPTLLSLVKAHAATLLDLRIVCATGGSTDWHFEARGLAEGLRVCRLVKLQRLVLLRNHCTCSSALNRKMQHVKAACKLQKRDLSQGLLEAASIVLCEECDRCPEYPPLGDFTL